MAKLTDWVLGVVMLLLFVAVLAQVAVRYLLNFSFVWADELPTLLYAWLVFLAVGAGLAEGRHLGVAFVQDAFPARLRRVCRCVVDLAILGFLVFCIVTGWQLAGIFGYYQYSSLPFSRYWLFVAVPTGCVIAVPIILKSLIADIRGEEPPREVLSHVQDQLT